MRQSRKDSRLEEMDCNLLQATISITIGTILQVWTSLPVCIRLEPARLEFHDVYQSQAFKRCFEWLGRRCSNSKSTAPYPTHQQL
eukprot:4449869-Amphidinium_carterae.1